MPQMPQMPCTGTAPIGSSMRSYSSSSTPRHHDHAGDAAEQDGAGRAHPVTRTGDRHQAGQEAVDGEADVPFLVHAVGRGHRRQTGRAGRQRRIRGDAADAFEIHRGERAARVESVPAEPQQQAAAKPRSSDRAAASVRRRRA